MKKRILSAFIVLCMVFSLCIVPAYSLGATSVRSGSYNRAVRSAQSSSKAQPVVTRGTTVLAFSSDVHNGSGNESANRLSGWIDNVISMYGGIDYMGFCGDMGSASAGESAFWQYTQSVMDVVSNHNIPVVYTTGNHELYNGNYPSSSSSVASNYKVDTEGANGSDFRIYALGTQNWNNSSDNYTQSQVTALTNYLNSVDNSKPIIILTHFPLHTASSGSSWWGGGRTTANADLVIDALNNAASAGKTIVLLWGHNHTVSDVLYDEIMYPGYEITYATGSTKYIQFYYAAAGCMSDSEYGSGSAYVKGKGLVITINNGALGFHYYNAAGTDVTENSDEPSPTLGPTPTPTAAPTAVPGTSLTQVSSFTNGRTYVIVADDGYALTCNETDVSFSNSGSGTQSYVYTGLDGTPFTTSSIVTSDMLWTAQSSGSGYLLMDQSGRYLNATYVSNSGGGYNGDVTVDSTTDVWTLSSNQLKSANASAGSSSDKFLTHGNSSSSSVVDVFTVRSSSSASTITLYEFSGEAGTTPAPTATPVPGTTETRFVETTALSAGNDYILAAGDGSTVNAITYIAGSTSSSNSTTATALTVTDGYIVTDNENLVWTRTSAGYFQNGSRYLYPSSSNGIMTYTSGREVLYANGHLYFETSSSGTYYVTYTSSGFNTSSNESDAATIRLFVKTEVSTGDPTPTPAITADPTATPTAAPTAAPGTLTQVSGFENGKTYVIVANDGYALTCNETDASFSNSGSGTQSYVYTGLAGVTFNANGTITNDMLWTAQSSGSGWLLLDQSGRYLNGIYESNGNGYNGDVNIDGVTDVWTLNSSNQLKSTNASSNASSDKFLTHGSGSSSNSVNVFTVRSSSSASTFTIYQYNGEVTPVEPTPTPVVTPEPTAVPTAAPGTLTQVSGFENGKTYVIVANDGYALTCNDTDASFSNSGSGTQSYVYTGLAGVVFDANGTITSDMLWTAQSSGSGWLLLDQSGRYLNGTYESNGNGYNGNVAVNTTTDIWTITSNMLRSANASSSSDKFLTHGSGSSSNPVNVFTVRSSSSASTITIYEYTGSAAPTEEPTPTPTVEPTPTTEPTPTPTPVPTEGTEIRYIETDTLVAGNDYIIAVDNGSGTVAAIGYTDSINAVTLNVTTGGSVDYITTDDTSVVWNRTESNFFELGGRYLYPTSSNSVTTYTSGRAINYANGHMYFSTSSSGTYYITYSNGTFGTSSSESAAANIRIFVKTEFEPGEEPTFTLGDVNNDGKVDASDAILIMRYTLNIIELTDIQKLAADINGSGTIDASDALMIMRKVLGLIA